MTTFGGEYFRERFSVLAFGSNAEARRQRDERVRELRKKGWTVTCKKIKFKTMGPSYILEAFK